MVVTLLSDAIIRDQNGHLCPSADAFYQEFASALTLSTDDLRRTEEWFDIAGVGGFNRKAGLPVIQCPAIRMGSVFKFSCQRDIRVRELKKMMFRGIGERRIEGFGRTAVNWHGKQKELNNVLYSGETIPQEKALAGATRDIAQFIVNRIEQCRAEMILPSLVPPMPRIISQNRTASDPTSFDRLHSITTTQLNRLRSVVADCLRCSPENGRQRLRNYLHSLQSRASVREMFVRARVGGQDFLSWLEHRLDDSTEIHDGIAEKLEQSTDERLTIGGVSADRVGQMTFELNLRLVIHVLMDSLERRKSGDN